MKLNYVSLTLATFCLILTLYTFIEKRNLSKEKDVANESHRKAKEDETLNDKLSGTNLNFGDFEMFNCVDSSLKQTKYNLLVFFSMKYCNSCVQSELEMIEEKSSELKGINILYIANTQEIGLLKRFSLINRLKYPIIGDTSGAVTNLIFSNEVSFVKAFLIGNKVLFCQTAEPKDRARSLRFLQRISRFTQ